MGEARNVGRTGEERREVKELRCARYGVYVGFGEGRGSMRRRGEKVRTRCGDERCGRGARGKRRRKAHGGAALRRIMI